MNYSRHYFLLCDRAISRTLPDNTYTERHHIMPRCIGGDNSKDNLIRLTAEEHYLAHQLLVKMFPNEPKLIFAANAMAMNRGGQRPNNKSFGWLRKAKASALTGVPRSKETIEKMIAGRAKRSHSHSAETKAKLSAFFKGKESPLKGRKREPLSAERKATLSDALKGKPKSEETKANMKEAWAKRKLK